MAGMDINEISGSHSGVAEDTILLFGWVAVAWGGGESDSRRFDRSSPFIFECRAVNEECHSRQTKWRHAPEHLIGQVHRCERQKPRKFCAMDLRRASGLGRFLRSDSRVRRTGWCRKEADSLLQLWNVAGWFFHTKNKPRPRQSSMRYRLVAYQRSRNSSVSIVTWLRGVSVMLTTP